MQPPTTIEMLSHAVGFRSPQGLSWGPQWVLDLVLELAAHEPHAEGNDFHVMVRVEAGAALWGLVTFSLQGPTTTLWLEQEDAELFQASLRT